jgi:geranylgeranyl diphosphate synthase type II
MIELKTAALLAASAKIGAILGGADDKDCEVMYEFGRNIGIAFQIQDDLLDIYGDIKIFGKIMGGDIISNKKTFMSVKALELASVEQARQLHEQFSLKEFDADAKVKKVVGLYDQMNIKSISENLSNEYINTAFSLLEKLKATKERKTELINIANSLIGREN